MRRQSKLPSHADIVVAGGGPAGATIALLLARFGYQVVLLEKRQFPRHQIGESLTPQILPILDFLGVRQQVEAAGFLRMIGHTVCWGSPQPRTSYYSADRSRYGFQAWREDFDMLLLAHAREAGVHVYEGLAVDSVTRDAGSHVTLCTRNGTLITDFFVDATGHAGILARHNLRQRDATYKTLAITGYWQGASGLTGHDFANTLLETYSNGLVWSVPLHNGLRNVTLLLDWNEGKKIRQTGLRDFYLAELHQTSYIMGFLSTAQLPQHPQVFDATWYTASAFAGEQFLLVGDAGLFVDPLSSEGVHKAMASAITGAIVANTLLKRPALRPHAIRFYNESQQLTYETHYQQSVRYYGEEQRWSGQPFWRTRTTPVQGSQFTIHNGEETGDLQRETRLPSSPSAIPKTQRISALRMAPGVRIEQRPVIEGPFIELREVVVAPPYPRGLRFLLDVHVPQLLNIVAQHAAVVEIITTYRATPDGTRTPVESIRQVLARLYQEGILASAEVTETG